VFISEQNKEEDCGPVRSLMQQRSCLKIHLQSIIEVVNTHGKTTTSFGTIYLRVSILQGVKVPIFS